MKKLNDMNKKLTLAIDVNTIFSDNPNVDGILRPDAVDYLKKLHQDGYFIIITSALSTEENKHIKSLLRKDGIIFDLFNANTNGTINFYKEDPRKISADIYIDNKSINGIPAHWRDIYDLIQQKWKK